MKNSIIDYMSNFNIINKISSIDSTTNWFQSFEYFRWNEDGSFTVKRDEDFAFAEEGLIYDLINESILDFKICGEDGCINNFDMYTPLFNLTTGMIYCIPYCKQEEYGKMQEVTIYGREVEQDELEKIYDYIRGEL